MSDVLESSRFEIRGMQIKKLKRSAFLRPALKPLLLLAALLLTSTAYAQPVLERWSVNGTPDLFKIQREVVDGIGAAGYIADPGTPQLSIVRFRAKERLYPEFFPGCNYLGSLGIAFSTKLIGANGVTAGFLYECVDIWGAGATVDKLKFTGLPALNLTRLP